MMFKILLVLVIGFCMGSSALGNEDQCGDCRILRNGDCKYCYEIQRECVVDLCVPADMSTERIEELKKAAQGNSDAQIQLGNEHFSQRRYEKALLWFRKAATSGDSGSYQALGCFFSGSLSSDGCKHSLEGDVPQKYVDLKEAEKCWLKAAEGGHSCAKFLLAKLYMRMGNSSEAQHWARKCVQEGHHESDAKDVLHRLGGTIVDSPCEPCQVLSDGKCLWCYEIEQMCINSKCPAEGYPDSIKKQLLQAIQGDSKALTAIGDFFFNGDRVEQDLSEAAKWYQKAVVKGSKKAACRLGFMYETGRGMPKYDHVARGFYTEGASSSPLGVGLYNACPDAGNDADVLKCYRNACERDAAARESR